MATGFAHRLGPTGALPGSFLVAIGARLPAPSRLDKPRCGAVPTGVRCAVPRRPGWRRRQTVAAWQISGTRNGHFAPFAWAP